MNVFWVGSGQVPEIINRAGLTHSKIFFVCMSLSLLSCCTVRFVSPSLLGMPVANHVLQAVIAACPFILVFQLLAIALFLQLQVVTSKSSCTEFS